MKIKTNKILFLLPILLMLFIVVGCSNNKNLKKYTSQMDKSMKIVKVVSTKIEMKDSDVLIYQYLKTGTVQEDKLNVTVEIAALDDTFELNKQSSTETVEELNLAKLLPFELKKDYMEDSKMETDHLEFSMTEENFKKLYTADDFNIAGNADFVYNFENEKIINITCIFRTTSGKDVLINTEYGY